MSDLGRLSPNDTRYVHHLYFVFDSGAALTSVGFQTDNFVVGAASLNVCFPKAARLVGCAAHTLAFVDTVPGNWTLRIRQNEGGVDVSTWSFALTSVASKTAGPPSVEALFQAGDTYHILADGPEKNTVIIRLTLEWEIL